MRRWWRIVTLALLLAACGGGNSDGDASAEDMVKSDDGRASLSLQPGSLPEGVLLDDVQLEVVVNNTEEPGAPVVAVQLLPDGLVLAEPATLTIAMPEGLEGGFMVIHMSGDSLEFLDGDIIQQGDEGFAFQTSVGHFSVLSIHGLGSFFETSMTLNPNPVSVGEDQRAAAKIAAKTNPITLSIVFESDRPNTARLFRFSAPQPPFSFDHAMFRWGGFRQLFWDPLARNVEITEAQFDWETSPASATCTEVNLSMTYFKSKAVLSLTLLSSGEAEARGFHEFSQELVEESSAQARAFGPVQLLDTSPGDTIEAGVHFFKTSPSRCTEAAVTISSTTTTTTGDTPHDGDPPGDQDSGTSGSATGKPPDGGDMAGQIPVVPGAPGEICFKIVTVGDSEETATGSDNGINWVDIGVSVADSGTEGGEWRASVFFLFDGSQTDRGVKLGPPAPGQVPLEGATVSVDWPGNDDTMWLCVFGGETKLAVETFEVAIGVQTENGDTFWDYATGQAE